MPSNAQLAQSSAVQAKAARLERAGDLAGALAVYESGLAALPDDVELLAGLAGLALRMGMPEASAGLWAKVCAQSPDRLDAIDGRAIALRAGGQFDLAADLLAAALAAHPADARLWNSLGVTLTDKGDAEAALACFEEALRLDGRLVAAAYNRGGALFDLGRFDEAKADFQRARKLARKPHDAAMIDFAEATRALAAGDIGAGWDAYEVRLSRDWAQPVVFTAPGRRWTPEAQLAGKRLLVLAEQGLGDEIMFANLLPDVLEALGPDGRLALAVEPRLVPLFKRSFPTAEVSAYGTELSNGRKRRFAPDLQGAGSIDLWTPMASLARRFRRSLADFPTVRGYLRPDPERVAHWRAWLGDGPAVGLTWRSGNLLGGRRREFPPLELWTSLLRTPGNRLVNLQYGDCAGELAAMAGAAGRPIDEPPGLDIRNDLDDLAALCCALDLVVSVPNATGALAGACGAPLLMLTGPVSWSRLGTSAYPWYPQAGCLTAPRYGEWEPVMSGAAAFVADIASGGRAAPAG
ncbi:tetratricopeptide repeat protein [Phenylobacterium sp.]|jgi:tetratricopeptide (TPR) repeat protein|uniref:tetratricopeptide repeat protein n=1 Tax=Phenylobacterium sp. TaxID=1871053 RepID=UPI002E34B4D2|nr:tetratricopeptide repeat protein [Phenylobacterium sp.]HEX2559932.1 tetratricopeptide repeat protein [Phenylobacterium sp.]